MKREFQEESFEEFLKRNADNLRMKAPDKIWQNLSAELNKGRRRAGAFLSAFLLATSVFAYLTINNNTSKNTLFPKSLTQTQSDTKIEKEKSPLANNHSKAAEQRISLLGTNGRNSISTTPVMESNPAMTAGSFLDQDEAILPVQTGVKETGEAAKSNDFISTIVDDLPSLPENTTIEAKEFLKP
ncbi:MAG TPA: hypothetical protein VFL47_12860, partial [Flavisolibacter sp.]|nr:hypothetical protein [Flavisolibacter sp.]